MEPKIRQLSILRMLDACDVGVCRAYSGSYVVSFW